ncbi:MAG: Hsp20/alpha crystallin family protein [Elusimicrobia bacterium]|nr:Hsp20/alpha crystallin family protein [Elusimicrobiota bacterium]
MADKHVTVMEKEAGRELERYDPFQALDPFREFRLRPFGGLFEDVFAPLRADVPSIPAAWMPRADVRETEKEYVIDLSLPGIRKEDVKVEVKDDVLTVSGERRTEKEEKGKSWLRRESSYGSFLRSFTLPEGLHSEDIKANYKDGVLTLSMRKPAQVKSRGVSIKVD